MYLKDARVSTVSGRKRLLAAVLRGGGGGTGEVRLLPFLFPLRCFKILQKNQTEFFLPTQYFMSSCSLKILTVKILNKKKL